MAVGGVKPVAQLAAIVDAYAPVEGALPVAPAQD
jgi:hypothetical protein